MLVNETRTQTLYEVKITVQIWASSKDNAIHQAERFTRIIDDNSVNDIWAGGCKVIQHEDK